MEKLRELIHAILLTDMSEENAEKIKNLCIDALHSLDAVETIFNEIIKLQSGTAHKKQVGLK